MTDEKDNIHPIPENWVWSSIGQLYDVVGGGTPSTKNSKYWNGDIPWITSADIHGVKDIRPRRTVSTEGIRESATNLVPEGSLIVVTRVGLGKVAITQTPLCFSQDSQALVGNNNLLNPEYSLYYLSKAVQIFKYKHRGTTIAGVTKKQLKNLPFPLPPFPEQGRIVSKLEELFTRLDAGVESLRNVKAQLQLYRQAVLKHAFNGELTEEWRKNHKDMMEPASTLLEHIRQERKKEQAGKYNNHLEMNIEKLPVLPESWDYGQVSELSQKIVDCLHSTPKFTSEGKLCIDTNCIEPAKILFGKARYVSEETYNKRVRRLQPKAGDILFAREGTIGSAAVVPENVELCLGQRMMMFRTVKQVAPRYFMWALMSKIFENQWREKVTGSTVPHVNIRDIKNMVIPITDMKEQLAIVDELERRFSVADETENYVNKLLIQSELLRQSILKKAFEGKLVNQDPTDESAERLLERVRKEKEKRNDNRKITSRREYGKRKQRRLDYYVE